MKFNSFLICLNRTLINTSLLFYLLVLINHHSHANMNLEFDKLSIFQPSNIVHSNDVDRTK